MRTVPRPHVVREAGPWCRRVISTTLLIAVLLVGAVGLPPVHAEASERHCTSTVLPVSLGDDQSLTAELFGLLCYRGDAMPRTVQVLVHGGTYDHRYWDWPVHNERYSYVNAATEAGYATFAFDRLGTGHSTKPPSGQVDLTANIATIHQVIQALRRGASGSGRRSGG